MAKKTLSKSSIEDFKKNNPKAGYSELKNAGYSESDIEKYKKTKKFKYDIERKSEKRERGKQVTALATQLRKAGITNFETKKGSPLDISDARRLLAGKPKGKSFKELINRILTSAGKHISSAVGGVKETAKKVVAMKKKSDDKKNTPIMLKVPIGAKTNKKDKKS